jgi:hypothetical protein
VSARRRSSRARWCSVLGQLLVWGSALAAPAPSGCAPEVIGTWKLEASALPDTTLLRFGTDGWASMLSGPSDRPATSYEIIAQVSYSLAARDPKRLRFSTQRGNDLFAAGVSDWDITAYSDQSLITQPAQVANAEQQQWSRVTTQRYFLTLAARRGTLQKPAAVFVLWTTLGAGTDLEALGMLGEGPSARFARIPLPLAREFTRLSGRAEDVILRIELSEAEYLRTHRVLAAWDGVLRNDQLARNEPLVQLNELLDATVQSVNRCATRLQLPPATEVSSAHRAPHPWIEALRRRNERRHVSDKVFPFSWRPGPVA